jgi:hypothetical protein
MSGHHWQPHHDELVRDMCLAKQSPKDIADAMLAQFGVTVTRKSVIGRAYRLKIALGTSRTGKPAEAKRYARGIRDRVIVPKAVKRLVLHKPAKPSPVADLVADVEIPLAVANGFLPIEGLEPVAFADLAPMHCRWPVSGLDAITTHFCGAQKMHGLSYCPSHRALSCGDGTRAERDALKKIRVAA